MINDLPFMMYAAECEGDMPTRTGKINRFIKLLAAAPNPNDLTVQSRVAKNCDIDLYSLNLTERKYIESEVNRLLEGRN
jgi:hypothetical protein